MRTPCEMEMEGESGKLMEQQSDVLPRSPEFSKLVADLMQLDQRRRVLGRALAVVGREREYLLRVIEAVAGKIDEVRTPRELVSRKIKPAARFKCYSEVYLFHDGRDEEGNKHWNFRREFDLIEAVISDMLSVWMVIGIPPISGISELPSSSQERKNDLMFLVSEFMELCNRLAENFTKAAHCHEHEKINRMAGHCHDNQRTEEEDDEMTKMDGGKSGTATQALRIDSKFKLETETEAVIWPEADDEQEIVSTKIKPAARIKCSFEFHHMMEQIRLLWHKMVTLLTKIYEINEPLSSSQERKDDLMFSISNFMKLSNRIAEDFTKAAHCHEHEKINRMARHCHDNQRTEEEDEEMTKLEMDGGKSGTVTQALRIDSKFKPETETEAVMGPETDDEKQEITVEQGFKMSKFKLDADGDADDVEDEEEMMMAAHIYKVLQKMERETPSHYKLDMEEREAPSRYKLNLTSLREEEEEKTEEEEEEEEEEETDFTKSAKEEVEEVYTEEQYFASYRRGWEFARGSKIGRFGGFEDPTTLSPMIFTYLTPGFEGAAAITGSTLQIYSIKIVEIKGNLNWPLHVYGVVAARDTVDYNRNLLFHRTRANCQELTSEDPFLRLTGPSRAIVALDPVDFEVELKIKDGTDSEDIALLSSMYHYTGCYNTGLYTALFDNRFCTIELNLERLTKTVQATILSVRVVEGGAWPFEYGGRVACSSPPQEVMIIDSQGTVTEVIDRPSRQVVLLDSHGGEMPIGSHGYLLLSRQVVSVELQRKHHYSLEWKESLKVVIQAYSPSGHIAAQGHVYFTPKYSNISQDTCDLGDSKVEIIVAWSRLLRDKMVFVPNGYV